MDHPPTPAVLTRRSLLAAASGSVAAAALSGCGGSQSSGAKAATPAKNAPIDGAFTFVNFPNWIGKHTIADFEAAYPHAKVRIVTDESTFTSELPKIHAQPGIFDMALAPVDEAQQAMALGVVEPLDFAAMPNTRLLDPRFLTTPVNHPTNYLVPTDWGNYGIAFRTDLVSENITSWNDLWRLAPKYSGKLYVYDYPTDLLDTALLKLGYKVNDTNQSHIMAAGKALGALKPHIGNLGTNGIAAALVNGSAAISVTYGYDAYTAAVENHKIRWIVPQEGSSGYLEGWIALKGNNVLPTLQAFMNFALQPRLYADFLSENDTAGTLSAADRYLPAALRNSYILSPPADVLRRITFQRFLGAAHAYYDQAYTAFKAS